MGTNGAPILFPMTNTGGKKITQPKGKRREAVSTELTSIKNQKLVLGKADGAYCEIAVLILSQLLSFSKPGGPSALKLRGPWGCQLMWKVLRARRANTAPSYT